MCCSDPQSQFHSQYDPPTSTKTWQPRRIWRVARGLKDAKKVSLQFMLNAFLARILSNDEDANYQDKVTLSKRTLDLMQCEAEVFCNSGSNQRSADLSKRIRDCFGQKTQNNQTASLSSALNSILLEFRSRRFAELPIPSENADEELIFISNDQLLVESSRIKDHISMSKRKPDIVATYVSRLRQISSDLADKGFEDLARLNSESSLIKASTQKIEWIDIHQTWEMAQSKANRAFGHEQEKVVERQHSMSQSATASRPRIQNGLKRPSAEEEYVPNKKARVSNQAEKERRPLQVVDNHYNLLPEIRCAYYAAERFSGGWHISHSTTVLLEGTKLSLRWYDAEGCIESEEIDIVEQTPILVLLLMVLQRFDKRLWGHSLEDPEMVKVGNGSYTLDAKARCAFDFVGRRTFGSTAVPLSPIDQDGPPQQMFFKSSWIKCCDRKEPDIINLVHERANSLLPEKHRSMVTDHIPVVLNSEECKTESTSIIRLLIKLAGGFSEVCEEDVMRNGRVRVWMVTRKLKVLHRIPPADFWRIFWELIRCHYLLWRIGIAHNDISLNNLMYYDDNGILIGVLNDNDLTSVVEPGTRTLEKGGFERAGTIPFMAMDLLQEQHGSLKRRYKHDLESFAWRLLWEMLETPYVCAAKTVDEELSWKKAFMSNMDNHVDEIREEWFPYFTFITTWLDDCFNHSKEISRLIRVTVMELKSTEEKVKLRTSLEDNKTDMQHLLPVIDAVSTVDCDVNCEVTRDISWLYTELLC